MVAIADYYVIESVHGVRQRIPLQLLRQRHMMAGQAPVDDSTSETTVASEGMADDSDSPDLNGESE